MLGFQYTEWRVSRRHKQPLLDFIIAGLKDAGCKILHASDAARAPFFITYETRSGEKEGALVYAFFANSKLTKNRPPDEHRFQVKYGGDENAVLPVEQDPAGLVTTIFVGVDLERGVLVGVDPVHYDGTPMFISVEFKRRDIQQVVNHGWHAWERESAGPKADKEKASVEVPTGVETLVGVTRPRILDYIRFEREATAFDAGHRMLLAERLLSQPSRIASVAGAHALVKELGLHEDALFELIHTTSRLKMAVRGFVAEVHLERLLQGVHGVDDCRRLTEEGRPDLEVIYKGRPPVLIECKNVLGKTLKDGTPKVDFQRTRASKSDPCSRYYRAADFELLAACLHTITTRWEFKFMLTSLLPAHKTCSGRIDSVLRLGPTWITDPDEALERVTGRP